MKNRFLKRLQFLCQPLAGAYAQTLPADCGIIGDLLAHVQEKYRMQLCCTCPGTSRFQKSIVVPCLHGNGGFGVPKMLHSGTPDS